MSSQMNMRPTDRVRAAIAHADQQDEPDGLHHESSYFTKCLEMRSAKSPYCMGSTYPYDVPTLRLGILALEWEAYSHPDIQAPAVGFIAREFGGRMGMAKVEDLDPSDEIELTDPTNTGFVEGHVLRTVGVVRLKVNFTVAILGPASDGTETLWTFHPGPPVPPSRIATLDRHGLVVTKARALELGLEWVKLS